MDTALHDDIKEFLSATLSLMRLAGAIDIRESISQTRPELSVTVTLGSNAEIIVGDNGQALDALEHIVRIICGRRIATGTVVTLDVNGHRRARLDSVIQHATHAAERVQKSGTPETLTTMSSYERRAVHTALATYPGIITESIGREPTRRIIVKAAPLSTE